MAGKAQIRAREIGQCLGVALIKKLTGADAWLQRRKVIAGDVPPAHALAALCRPDLGLGIENEGFVGKRPPIKNAEIPTGVNPGCCQVNIHHLARCLILELPEHSAVRVGLVGLPTMHKENGGTSGIVVGVWFVRYCQLVGVVLAEPVDTVVGARQNRFRCGNGTSSQKDHNQANANSPPGTRNIAVKPSLHQGLHIVPATPTHHPPIQPGESPARTSH